MTRRSLLLFTLAAALFATVCGETVTCARYNEIAEDHHLEERPSFIEATHRRDSIPTAHRHPRTAECFFPRSQGFAFRYGLCERDGGARPIYLPLDDDMAAINVATGQTLEVEYHDTLRFFARSLPSEEDVMARLRFAAQAF